MNTIQWKGWVTCLVLSFFQSCTTNHHIEDEPQGTGILIHNGFPSLNNCFGFYKKTATGEWEHVTEPYVLKEDVSDYFPVKLRNSPYAYNLMIHVPTSIYTNEQYLISLKILTKDWKPCSESKTATFYRISEQNGIVDYGTYKDGVTFNDGQGFFIFLAQKEMPSLDWYHILKTCGSSFRIEGEVL